MRVFVRRCKCGKIAVRPDGDPNFHTWSRPGGMQAIYDNHIVAGVQHFTCFECHNQQREEECSATSDAAANADE